jgi:hypothetical protein
MCHAEERPQDHESCYYYRHGPCPLGTYIHQSPGLAPSRASYLPKRRWSLNPQLDDVSTRFDEPPGREGGPLVAYLTDVDSHQHLGKTHLARNPRTFEYCAGATGSMAALGRGVTSAARGRSHLACARPCDSVAPESVGDVLQTLRKGPSYLALPSCRYHCVETWDLEGAGQSQELAPAL